MNWLVSMAVNAQEKAGNPSQCSCSIKMAFQMEVLQAQKAES